MVPVGVEQVQVGIPSQALAPWVTGAVTVEVGTVHGGVELAVTVAADGVGAVSGLAGDRDPIGNSHAQKTSDWLMVRSRPGLREPRPSIPASLARSRRGRSRWRLRGLTGSR